MSEYRPYQHVLKLAALMYPKKEQPRPGPLPDPQMEADFIEWRNGGCKGPAWSMIRPRGKPNLRPI